MELSYFWDSELNTIKLAKIEDIPKSARIHWKCPICLYQWTSLMGSVFRNKKLRVSCKACSFRSPASYGESLEFICPELVKDWDFEVNRLSPKEYKPQSNALVSWLCNKCSHRWTSTICNRFKGQGCPCCAGKIIKPGFNDLASINAELAAEWHPTKNGDLTPSDVSSVHSKSVWWLAKDCSHAFKLEVNERVYGSGQCPVCFARHIVKNINDFESQQPELMKEWDYDKNASLMPSMISSKSSTAVWWKCKRGHSWKTSPGKRVTRGDSCKECSKTPDVERSFAKLYPEFAEEWVCAVDNDRNASEHYSGSATEVWWYNDSCGHLWKERICDRTRSTASQCLKCSPRHYSNLEKLVLDFVKSKFDGEILHGKRPLVVSSKLTERKWLSNWQVDIWCPEIGLAIEVQDFATHSKTSDIEPSPFIINKERQFKHGPTYHNRKAQMVREQLKCELIEIWQDQIFNGEMEDILDLAISKGLRQRVANSATDGSTRAS